MLAFPRVLAAVQSVNDHSQRDFFVEARRGLESEPLGTLLLYKVVAIGTDVFRRDLHIFMRN